MLAVVGTAVAGVGFVAGRVVSGPVPDPIRMAHGVPVGVDQSRAGALAAADSYIATEQATIEEAPARFAALVSEVYAARLKAGALAAGARARLEDPRGVRLWAGGGESFTAVGAQRLDSYRGDSATVTTWAVQVFWGPGQQPCQVWALGQITLAWQGGRWRVTTMRLLPGPAPAPASLPQAAAADDITMVFDARLEGFSPVGYGSVG